MARLTPGTSTASNSRCTLSLSGSGASAAGNDLTVSFNLTFTPAFGGNHNVNTNVSDVDGAGTGWITPATYHVNHAPTVDSVSPFSGSGIAATFTFRYSDPNGGGNISRALALINGGVQAAGACYFEYVRGTGQIALVNDSGVGMSAPVPLASGGPQNSQCTIQAGGTAAVEGNTLVLTVPIRFTSGFNGSRQIYMLTQDAAGHFSDGAVWQSKGSFNVIGNSAPSAVSVSPSAASGNVVTFTATFSDPNGYQDLRQALMVVNSELNGATGCQIQWLWGQNTLYLLNETGSANVAVTPGSGMAENSRCVLHGAGAAVSQSGTNLVLTVPVTFKVGFAGTKKIYMYTDDSQAAASGWHPKGTYTVSGNQSPSAVGVTPASGSGASAVLGFTFRDPNGYMDLGTQMIIINYGLDAGWSCTLEYDRALNAIRILNNFANAWSDWKALGSGDSVENSQCRLRPANSSSSAAGTDVTVNVAIDFLPAFRGTRNVYMLSRDVSGVVTDWGGARGSWVVP